MVIDWLIVLEVLCAVAIFATGFLFGMIFWDIHNTKLQEAKELEAKQQQMWNEYLEAVRGGQNAK